METGADSSRQTAVGVSTTRSGRHRVWLPAASESGVVDEVLRHLAQERFPMDLSRTRPGDGPGSWLLHGGKKSDVVGVRLSALQTFAVKVFHDRRLIARFRTALGRGKGRRGFQVGLRLAQLAVSAPRIYAYAERRPFGEAMLIMEWLPDFETLQNILCDNLMPERELRTAAILLGEYLATLHAHGVHHADLSSRNILLDPSDVSRGVAVVDFEDISFFEKPLSTPLRTAQLAELAGTIREIPLRAGVRCLLNYMRVADIRGRVASYARDIRAFRQAS
jgi:serine/threonine protein kinase